MSYKKFKQDGIDYTLFLANHFQSSLPTIERAGGLESLDVLVLETGTIHPDTPKGLDSLMRVHQYKEIFDTIKQESLDTKIYLIDFDNAYDFINLNIIPPALTIYSSNMVFSAAIIASFAPAVINALKRGEAIQIINYPSDLINLTLPTPVLGLRNAVTAKKITEFVVPKEQKNNLRVGVLYGAAHSGIELNIQYPTTTKYALALYENLGWFGVKNKEQLNHVVKLEFVDVEWVTEKTDCQLFNVKTREDKK